MPRKWPNGEKEELSREDLKNILNETIKEKDLTREWKKMFLSLVLSDLVENGYLTSNRKDKLQRNLKKYVSGVDKKRKNDETKNIKKPELSKKIQIWEKETEISEQELKEIKTKILDAMEKNNKKNGILKVIAFALISATIGRGGYEAYDYLKNKSDKNPNKAKTEKLSKDTTAEIVKTVDEIEGNDTLPNDRNNNTRAYTETGKQNVVQTVVNENTETDDDDWGEGDDIDVDALLAETQEEENNLDNNINKNNTTIANQNETKQGQNTTISKIDEETAKVNAEIEKLQGEKED